MKEVKLSFPYPSTSRHNLSQDIALSASLGLVIPARVVEVLPGDSHRIGTSFSLVSNPLVKPLLQGVRMRYCRFWVPRRIYNQNMRANNSNFDPRQTPVRYGSLIGLVFPGYQTQANLPVTYISGFQASSLFDYLGVANLESNLIFRGYSDDNGDIPDILPNAVSYLNTGPDHRFRTFNAEPYIAYYDICRNYFADSATGLVSFVGFKTSPSKPVTVVAPLDGLDQYIDSIQNQTVDQPIIPYDPTWQAVDIERTSPFVFTLEGGDFGNSATLSSLSISGSAPSFFLQLFGYHHYGLCVPLNRPDRMSRLFDLRPLTSQNATINPSEITVSNLSFLAKLQRYLTRRFFGGSRFTDVMYSIFGQSVPHVDSPVLLDVFDQEIGSELVASTNADESSNPGVLGGFFASSGVFSTSSGRSKKRYSFNEAGYLIDVFYIMPRLFRSAFLSDFYPVDPQTGQMLQANFIPDFNGIGWQQPAFVSSFLEVTRASDSNQKIQIESVSAFSCEPSWQQYRTLPDLCRGLLNPLRGIPSTEQNPKIVGVNRTLNSPLFTFNDRMDAYSFYRGLQYGIQNSDDHNERMLLARQMFTSVNDLNSVFGTNELLYDNMFIVFRYAHQVKSQVTKRFTLNFN